MGEEGTSGREESARMAAWKHSPPMEWQQVSVCEGAGAGKLVEGRAYKV